ncbi:helix-turn-helix transcriptional regulator [Bittarella sp. HCP28S3_D9]|uniref:helix-turn-helix transcriptional regulator n=1 Tax=Bittarella sp. HCP28S3_D9 TaxID=3440253 RepID=UPI003F8B3951
MNSARKLAAEAVAIIEGELQRRISLAELAERLHYSPYYLQRAFVGAVGLPPARYAQRRRLTEAALQLCYTRRPLADIALAAGYESQQAFTAAFAAFYKQPPRAFREEGRFYPLQLRHRPRQLCSLPEGRGGLARCARPKGRTSPPGQSWPFPRWRAFPTWRRRGLAAPLRRRWRRGGPSSCPPGRGSWRGRSSWGARPGGSIT